MKRHKKQSHELNPGLTNAFPNRRGRRVIGQPSTPLLKEDPTNRRLDDFSRSSGYHPSQPLVTGRIVKSGTELEESQLLMNVTQPGAENIPEVKEKPKKEHDFRKWVRRTKRSFAFLVLLVIVGAVFLFAKGYINLSKVFGGNSSNISVVSAPSALKTEGDGRINILLLGIGGVGHDGPDLTDTMLLVSINPVNKTAALLSVPRDLWVNDPGSGEMKINAVYETGLWKYLGYQSDSNQNQKAVDAGFNSVNQLTSQILGIPIKYDVLVNFEAFQEAVDTLGGIDVNVPTELYDPTIAWQNDNNPVIAEPGAQTFNGAQALLYVRSRETTSDFARTQRQRQVMIAIKNKALTLGTFSNPVKLAKLSDEFGDNVVTNLSLADANTIYGLVKNMSDEQIQSIGLADSPNNYVKTVEVDNQSTVEPTAGFNNYSAIQYYVRNTLKDGYLEKENASLMVLSGTGQLSQANNEAQVLKSYGYNVTSVGVAPSSNYTKTALVDLTNGTDKYTAHYLELRLGTKTTTELPDNSIKPGNANFVIILGQDEANNS